MTSQILWSLWHYSWWSWQRQKQYHPNSSIHGPHAPLLGWIAEWLKSLHMPPPQTVWPKGRSDWDSSFLLLDLSLFLDLQGFTGSLWSSASKGKSCCLRYRSSQITSVFHPAQDVLLNNRHRYQKLIKALFSKHQVGVYPGFQRLDII